MLPASHEVDGHMKRSPGPWHDWDAELKLRAEEMQDEVAHVGHAMVLLRSQPVKSDRASVCQSWHTEDDLNVVAVNLDPSH
jgi:hypothetical protein